MGHTDYEHVTTLDALIDVSDAAARACMVRLREQLARLDADLDERLVMDGLHRKPTIAFYRGDDALLHVYPEPGVANGLHVSLPVRAMERNLIDARGLSPSLAELLRRAVPKHQVLWLEATMHAPHDVDDLLRLVARRVDLLPKRIH